MKSASTSSLPPHKYDRKRLAKRGVDIRPMERDDLKYFWPAYCMGQTFGLPQGLKPSDLVTHAYSVLDGFAEIWTLLGRTKDGERPVGYVTAVSDTWRAWFQFAYFPWASPRNRLETMVAFLDDARRNRMGYIHIQLQDKALLDRAMDYAVVTRVGTNAHYFGRGVHAMQYETVLKRL